MDFRCGYAISAFTQSRAVSNSSRQLLDAAYARLGFDEGDLSDAIDRPTRFDAVTWTDKGDWLTLAQKVGAEKVFFVNNYPVAVFADAGDGDPQIWTKYFNSVWCMARPQLLFLARDGELSVYNLNVSPPRPRSVDDRVREQRLLDSVRATADVQSKLSRFRRDELESGKLFEDERFGRGERADRMLIRDLGKVRNELIAAGLSESHAHTLMGRSIFIRYLEDRRVLIDEYFQRVAARKLAWKDTLKGESLPGMELDHPKVFYPSVLRSKEFCYALFEQLSHDFNGDLFPVDENERKAVSAAHLKLLRKFLMGEMENSLFFFAYRFDIIPIELISSIYEKFYTSKPGQKRNDGSYYTDASLVDFVLSHTLDKQCLDGRPRVVDPACGSGIFLVEAFRRIVRHRMTVLGRRLRPSELRTILRDQIRGIDINPEAVRVAAFSLYLAMLHYLEPPDILQHHLPFLTYVKDGGAEKNNFDILLAVDAFGIEELITSDSVRCRFSSGCADVVVGNPPWGSPTASDSEAIKTDRTMRWCAERNLEVGDKERSQAFIHRASDMLTESGRAGLLVSTGVFFKRHEKSQAFRQQWFSSVSLRKVFNFAAVRDAFFLGGGDGAESESRSGAIAPFAAVIFDKATPTISTSFEYWCAKETAFIRRAKAVVLNRSDFCQARQGSFASNDSLWKIYWWGNHRDEELIGRLRIEPTLSQVFDPENKLLQSGYKKGADRAKKDPSGWLREFKEVPARSFVRYGVLPEDCYDKPPAKVERRRERMLYEGPRLLIKRGISSDEIAQGRIVARFETDPFCYRHSIYSLPIDAAKSKTGMVALGVIWSSLTRYFLFMTSGTWGLWHDEVLKETLVNLPFRVPNTQKLTERIVGTVEKLRNLPPEIGEASLFEEIGLSAPQRRKTIQRLEGELDQSIFELFELTDAERERVEEVCGMGLDLFYRGMNSEWVDAIDWPDEVPRYGYASEVADTRLVNCELAKYLRTFVDIWEPYLRRQEGRLYWRIVKASTASSMIGVIFQAEGVSDPIRGRPSADDEEWKSLIDRIATDSRQVFKADRVYIDGLVRIVIDSDIVIIKRNERRLWTSSSARDDAEATMLLAMQSARTSVKPR